MDIFDLPAARLRGLPKWTKARRGEDADGPLTVLYWQNGDAILHIDIKARRLSPALRKTALGTLGNAVFDRLYGCDAFKRVVLAKARAAVTAEPLTGEDLRLANELAKYTTH